MRLVPDEKAWVPVFGLRLLLRRGDPLREINVKALAHAAAMRLRNREPPGRVAARRRELDEAARALSAMAS